MFGKHTYVQEIWKMEGWGKFGVQRAPALHPNSCYNELFYIEVQVYEYLKHLHVFSYSSKYLINSEDE